VLAWHDPCTYQRIDVLRDGEVVATLPPGESTYLDEETCEVHEYQIRGTLDCARSSSSGRIEVPACFVRGEINLDGSVDLGDVLGILFFLFAGKYIGCHEAADSNADGSVDVSDVTFLLTYLFLGGEEPAQPFAACGSPGAAYSLSCRAIGPCP
jgi:hypothetical protein